MRREEQFSKGFLHVSETI